MFLGVLAVREFVTWWFLEMGSMSVLEVGESVEEFLDFLFYFVVFCLVVVFLVGVGGRR